MIYSTNILVILATSSLWFKELNSTILKKETLMVPIQL